MALKKRASTTTTSRDPVTSYARNIHQGRIIAGPEVRAACRRHLADLDSAENRGLRFDKTLAERVIKFFSDELRLASGKHEAKPFIPLDWQKFILGSLFGWIHIATGKRRFRMAYVETAKGSGKSPLLAGIGIYLLVADQEPGAEIYVAATTKDQAKIPFRAAAAMHTQSPGLSTRLVASVANREVVRLTYHKDEKRRAYGFMTIISSDENQSGPLPHGILIDELHEWRDAALLNVLEGGMKGREQPLMVMITNSGKKKLGVCWDNHEYARKVVHGMHEDDSFFGYVCSNDKAADGKTEIDPFDHPNEWIKTNPSLGVTIQCEYLERAVNRARNVPSLESDVRRLNFNQWGWGENANPWISFDLWQAAGRDYTLSDLTGRRAYIGLDIAAVHDLTACIFLVEPDYPGEPWYMLPYFWLPKNGLAARTEKENVPWIQWERDGFLHTCPGPVICYEEMAKTILEVAENFDIQGAGRDPAMKNACDRELMAADMAWPWIWEEVRQGYITMGPAIKEMERRLVSIQTGQAEDEQGSVVGMVHPRHPILTMCVANAVIARDAADNCKFEKAKSTGRIDGIVAAANATSLTLTVESNILTPDDFSFY